MASRTPAKIASTQAVTAKRRNFRTRYARAGKYSAPTTIKIT